MCGTGGGAFGAGVPRAAVDMSICRGFGGVMDVRDLRYALAVYDAGGFAQAAKRTYVSRQAMSQAVKRLEASAGVRLFDVRDGNRLVPTAQGAEFLEDARGVVECFDEFLARRGLDARPCSHAPSLTVSMATGVAFSLPHGFIGKFRAQNPTVVVQVEEANTEGALSLLASGGSDLALVGSYPEYLDGFEYKLTVPTGLWLAVPHDNPLSRKPFLVLEDLDQQPVVTAGKLNHLHRYLVQACARAGVRLNIPATSSNAEELVGLAATYRGLFFAFSPGMMPDLKEYAAVLQLRTPEAQSFGTYVVRRRGDRPSEAACRFWESV